MLIYSESILFKRGVLSNLLIHFFLYFKDIILVPLPVSAQTTTFH